MLRMKIIWKNYSGTQIYGNWLIPEPKAVRVLSYEKLLQLIYLWLVELMSVKFIFRFGKHIWNLISLSLKILFKCLILKLALFFFLCDSLKLFFKSSKWQQRIPLFPIFFLLNSYYVTHFAKEADSKWECQSPPPPNGNMSMQFNELFPILFSCLNNILL